jgi:hypothetical protein
MEVGSGSGYLVRLSLGMVTGVEDEVLRWNPVMVCWTILGTGD